MHTGIAAAYAKFGTEILALKGEISRVVLHGFASVRVIYVKRNSFPYLFMVRWI
jgi:hypothetical protein